VRHFPGRRAIFLSPISLSVAHSRQFSRGVRVFISVIPAKAGIQGGVESFRRGAPQILGGAVVFRFPSFPPILRASRFHFCRPSRGGWISFSVIPAFAGIRGGCRISFSFFPF
jgi:hypothetical protein